MGTWDKYENHFKALIAPIFPANAEIRRIPSEDGLYFLVDWKLKTDPDRPNKRSKKIALRICEETLEDCDSATVAKRTTADEDIKKAVAARLAVHDSTHNTQYGFPEPRVEWYIPSREFNT